jgi:adenine/guanine phosphoribosyltransferase-like PRPP-binding protein
VKYRELSEILNLPPPAIWRYVTLRILPNYERAENLVKVLTSREVVSGLLRRYVRFKESAVDVQEVLSNVVLMKILAYTAYRYLGPEVDAVLTVELDGVPLATLVSELFRSKLAVARKGIPITSEGFYEVEYMSRDPPSIVRLYIPYTGIKKGDRVLIVDDIIRSGRTSAALAKLIKSVGATLVGIYSPIAVGTEWVKTLGEYLDKVFVILKLEP